MVATNSAQNFDWEDFLVRKSTYILYIKCHSEPKNIGFL